MTTDERDRLSAFALRVWGYRQGEVVSLMIDLGDRLGLYRAMAGQGPMTAAELAAVTGLQQRWLLEWLRGQAAAGLIGTEDGEAFELSTEAVAVLADDRQSLWFAAGAFTRRAAQGHPDDGAAWRDNLRNPLLAMMYGLSVTSCMSSGLSEPGGAGLGTLGLHPELAERICRDAGFSRFSRHDSDDPVNFYYEVRP
jgi:hypothetical protein